MKAEINKFLSIRYMSEKPLLLLTTRDLSNEEVGELYKHYTHVLTVNDNTSNRKVIEFKNDTAIVCDIRTKTGKDYYSENSKYLDENKDNVVIVRQSGDRFGNATTIPGVKYNAKRIRTNCRDKMEFLHHLLQLIDVPAIAGKKKRLLKGLVNCLCRSSQRD